MAYLDAEELGEFDVFETLPELLAFLYEKKGGEPTLRAHLEEFDDFRREFLEDTAAELAAMDLPKVAEVVAEFAAKASPMDDMRFCPFPDTPENVCNIKSWLANTRSRLKRRRMKRGQ